MRSASGRSRSISRRPIRISSCWRCCPNLQQDTKTLDQIYRQGRRRTSRCRSRRWSTVNTAQHRPAVGVASGPVPGGDAVVQPAARRGARPGGGRDPSGRGARSANRIRSIGSFQGNAQAFQSSLSNEPVLILAALLVVYVILGVLYESYRPPADHSVDAAVGRRRRAARAAGSAASICR